MITEPQEVATRKSSELVLDAIADAIPELLSGSADLTPSNNTKVKAFKEVTPGDFAGRYIHWGIREHGMCAALNGIALHGGIVPLRRDLPRLLRLLPPVDPTRQPDGPARHLRLHP